MADDKLDDLAIERTELALERTHLAWMRTVIGLITSGFAIDQLVEAFRQKRILTGDAVLKHAHMTGLILTITGSVLTILITAYYIRRGKELVKMKSAERKRMLPGIILSVFIFFISLVLIYLIESSG